MKKLQPSDEAQPALVHEQPAADTRDERWFAEFNRQLADRALYPRALSTARRLVSWLQECGVQAHSALAEDLLADVIGDRTIREAVARPKILDAIRERLLSPDGVAHTRRRIAEELRDYSKRLDAELHERKERLQRTEEKMAGLVDFLATGDRSQYVISTLRDLEQFTKQEREAIVALEAAAREPLRLPSIDEVEAQVRRLDARMQQDPESAKEQIRRWLRDGSIRIGPREDGATVAEGALLPLMVIDDGQNQRTPKRHLPETTSMISGRYTVVAGAGAAH